MMGSSFSAFHLILFLVAVSSSLSVESSSVASKPVAMPTRRHSAPALLDLPSSSTPQSRHDALLSPFSHSQHNPLSSPSSSSSRLSPMDSSSSSSVIPPQSMSKKAWGLHLGINAFNSILSTAQSALPDLLHNYAQWQQAKLDQETKLLEQRQMLKLEWLKMQLALSQSSKTDTSSHTRGEGLDTSRPALSRRGPLFPSSNFNSKLTLKYAPSHPHPPTWTDLLNPGSKIPDATLPGTPNYALSSVPFKPILLANHKYVRGKSASLDPDHPIHKPRFIHRPLSIPPNPKKFIPMQQGKLPLLSNLVQQSPRRSMAS